MLCNQRFDGTLRINGLPLSVTKAQINEFFTGFEVANNCIGLLTDRAGCPTGEAFVQFASVSLARKAKVTYLGRFCFRNAKIYESNLVEANQAIQRQMYLNMGILSGGLKRKNYTWINPFYKYISSANQTSKLIDPPIQVISNSSSNSTHSTQHLKFSTTSTSCTLSSEQWTLPDCDNNLFLFGNSKCRVRMRGLPYTVTEADIVAFFLPIQPLTIRLCLNKMGCPNGEADVKFATISDTKEALRKNRAKIGTRYIELFSSASKLS